MSAAFREVIESMSLIRREDGSMVLPAHPPALIDRIEFETNGTPMQIEVRDLRDQRLITGIQLSGSSAASFHRFAEPLRSDRIVITTPGSNAPLAITRAHGLQVTEIPAVEGFHPFLEKHLR